MRRSPAGLIESELFGHEKGAFTGAMAQRLGRFEVADGGTLFLDEVTDLPIELQGRLLRVLQEGEFERVGSSRTRRVDVRVIAATNRDLERLMRDGRFRLDLYYRLTVFPITLPPLRDRPEDIPELVWCFITRHQRRMGRHIARVPRTAMEALQRYDWPGNLRELQNVVERAMIRSTGDVLEIDETFVGDGRQADAPGERAHAGRRGARAHRGRARRVRLADQRHRARGREARPQAQHAPLPHEEAGHRTAGPPRLTSSRSPRPRQQDDRPPVAGVGAAT